MKNKTHYLTLERKPLASSNEHTGINQWITRSIVQKPQSLGSLLSHALLQDVSQLGGLELVFSNMGLMFVHINMSAIHTSSAGIGPSNSLSWQLLHTCSGCHVTPRVTLSIHTVTLCVWRADENLLTALVLVVEVKSSFISMGGTDLVRGEVSLWGVRCCRRTTVELWVRAVLYRDLMSSHVWIFCRIFFFFTA